MTSSVCVLLSCLLLVVQGSAGMDSDQQIEQVVSKMMAAKMGELEEKVQEMRAEMMEKDREMEVMREEMQEKVDVIREAMEEKDNKVKKQLDVLEARNTELTSKLREVEQKSLRDLPYVLTCAFQSSWYTPGATITYERLTVDYNNSDKPGGGDGRMDISTGLFTALTPGHYTVTYSGFAEVGPGEGVYFQLRKNGVDVGSEWDSFSSGPHR